MIPAYFQDGWMLDWLAKAASPGILIAALSLIGATVFSVKFYGRMGELEAGFSELKTAMITKADLDLALQKMGGSLKDWADGRFHSKPEHAMFRDDQGRIHSRQNDDIKYLLDRDRETNRRRAPSPD